MFIEIAKHDGVTKQDRPMSSWKRDFNITKICIYSIAEINFYEENDNHIIEFQMSSYELVISFSFSTCGMGEYHRIKRILDDKTIR